MSYNCDNIKNIHTDFKEVDFWVDVPISVEKNRNTPNKPIKPKLQKSPRTSSPAPDIDERQEDAIESRNAYIAWKDHLHEAPVKMKVRGALFASNEFISGHLVMKEHEKREYNKENDFTPALNKCFVNLLINGPTPLICRIHSNTDQKKYLSKCHCLPMCTCERDLAQNPHLPIGYRHNEHGLAEPIVSAINEVANYRDPMCIYTN